MALPDSGPSARGLLRFLTCGSVDDGKSSLIGRLLFEARAIMDDQMAKLDRDSRKHGTTGAAPDLALLVDGLQAEREQGITIDVAYRFFGTPRRKFIVADTPGHEQYTRNMATGASTADLAIILVDARKRLLPQTFRHSRIAALLGIRHVVLAVNKMDLVGYDQAVFEAIRAAYAPLAQGLGFRSVESIPVSALNGCNIAGAPASTMPWYQGVTLLPYLETVDITPAAPGPFRMPVQHVIRVAPDFRGYAGTIAGGTVAPGDSVVVLPSGRASRVGRIVTMAGDLPRAGAGQAVTLTLADDVDIARGDLLASAESPPEFADQLAADLVWMAETPLLPGRRYLLRVGTSETGVAITALKHEIDIATGEPRAARALAMNAIGRVTLGLDRAIPFDPYESCRETGGFILIDRESGDVLAAGMIRHALRRASNIAWQGFSVDRAARARLKGHQGAAIWFTGLSGSGKSTLADRLDRALVREGCHTYVLDGDNIRHGLNRDLGFTEADRVENIRRVAEVARLFVDAGLIVIVSFISPFRADRAMARSLFEPGRFFEVFVDTPLEECERRDPKGLYAKARAGKLPNFTGIDQPYEPPETPELRIMTGELSPEAGAERLLGLLRGGGILP
ncbi:MAG: sulfate adenylyltransferase subunit CysN [Hyphomicrobiales bacterium]|uniref:sulfate adenylyltransferase subunit CysN n=1 Tax=Rhabdaerophilum calidifontis TaxID=2604328 RepID=UPI001239ED9D|nr:sulfate adenylyltransferase subunit CysN [Rhabdaerophilum calidifontis]MCA1952948.1 sulfate adenylyltransferase subunit CysN [Hyphomicrobiales bacterium]MCA1999512.1 sulfate adenylyltransferase subunit CysN [Hyphomicrobiales bacterium]